MVNLRDDLKKRCDSTIAAAMDLMNEDNKLETRSKV